MSVQSDGVNRVIQRSTSPMTPKSFPEANLQIGSDGMKGLDMSKIVCTPGSTPEIRPYDIWKGRQIVFTDAAIGSSAKSTLVQLQAGGAVSFKNTQKSKTEIEDDDDLDGFTGGFAQHMIKIDKQSPEKYKFGPFNGWQQPVNCVGIFYHYS